MLAWSHTSAVFPTRQSAKGTQRYSLFAVSTVTAGERLAHRCLLNAIHLTSRRRVRVPAAPRLHRRSGCDSMSGVRSSTSCESTPGPLNRSTTRYSGAGVDNICPDEVLAGLRASSRLNETEPRPPRGLTQRARELPMRATTRSETETCSLCRTRYCVRVC